VDLQTALAVETRGAEGATERGKGDLYESRPYWRKRFKWNTN
jgi:hypothetical protein